MESKFQIKDTGQRKQYESGMIRDTNEGKTKYALILDGPMLRRWAEHMTKGAIKYNDRNWMKAYTEEELNRFRESAFNHFVKWYYGLEPEEDHGAALFFNINGAEYVKEKIIDEQNTAGH